MIVLRVVLALVCVVVIIAGLGAAYLATQIGSEEDLMPRAEIRYTTAPAGGAGTISVSGLITPATVRGVRAMTDTYHADARFLRIWSAGGTGPAAADLAALVRKTGLVVQIQPGTVCSSACVMFLADLPPAQRQISPQSWLRVHGRAGPHDPPDSGDPRQGMGFWAGKLSPPWLDYLVACPSQPLFHDAGIAMPWAEIAAVEQGQGPSCAAIAHRTKTWLFEGPGNSIQGRAADQARQSARVVE